MQALKAAIVGCGRMGQNHATVLEELGIDLISLADPIESSRENIINNWNGISRPLGFNTIDELLSHSRPDLLVIATTADMHTKYAIHAINAGIKLLLLEKPVSTSLEECRLLIEKAEMFNAKVAVNHQMRYLPQYAVPKKLIQSKIYGGIESMVVTAGNFGLAMNGTHYFEAFRFLCDEEPVAVSAWFDNEVLANPRGERFCDRSGCIRVTTESNRRLYLDASAGHGHGVQVTYMSRQGRITVDELEGRMTTVVRKQEHADAPTSRYGMPVDIEEHVIKPVELVQSTKEVLKALLEDRDFPNLHDASLAVKTLVAAYHSHRQGGIEVRLKDIQNNDTEVFPWA